MADRSLSPKDRLRRETTKALMANQFDAELACERLVGKVWNDPELLAQLMGYSKEDIIKRLRERFPDMIE
jgi:hypothetical protein